MLVPAILLLAPVVQAQSPASLEDMERRLEQLEMQQYDKNRNWSDRISVNGFMSYGITRHDVHVRDGNGDPIEYIDRTTDKVSHRELSRAGVQFNASISDQTSATVQILARGKDHYDAEVQWAYLSHDLSPSVTMRAGRMVLPFFMHTQYNNVGYAYHWATLPGEAYDVVPFDTMEGVDLSWNVNTGPVSHRLNVYGGATDVPSFSLPAPVVYNVSDLTGINLTSQWRDWTSWLSYSHAEVSLDLSPLAVPLAEDLGTTPDVVLPMLAEPVSLDDANTYISSVGLQYDNGSLLLMAERTQLGIEGWFPTKWGGYVSAGYRFGKWLPHVTWGAANAHGVSDAADDGGLAVPFSQANMVRSKSWTVGTRYELSPGIAVKLEAQRFYDMSNEKISTNGLFTPPGGTAMVPAIEEEEPTVYRLTIDAAF
tara:strand:+ start:1113 stop:2387 length:1275 start_codon:yes stop_codon:yes gene_type:complete